MDTVPGIVGSGMSTAGDIADTDLGTADTVQDIVAEDMAAVGDIAVVDNLFNHLNRLEWNSRLIHLSIKRFFCSLHGPQRSHTQSLSSSIHIVIHAAKGWDGDRCLYSLAMRLLAKTPMGS